MEQHSGEPESWTTGHFDATLLTNELRVGFIPAEALVQCTHALVKLLVLDAEQSDASSLPYDDQHEHGFPASSPAAMGTSADGAGLLDMAGLGDGLAGGLDTPGVNIMLVQDMGGVTVIVNERYYMHLQLAGVVGLMRWAPASWRALQIHLGPASADAPGIISYLSSMLSERDVSILNFSTFEADLILVQDHDLTKARELLVECGHNGVSGLKEQIAEKRMGTRHNTSGTAGSNGAGPNLTMNGLSAGRAGKPRSLSVCSDTVTSAALAVVQTPLVLATVKRIMLKQSMFSLMKQLTRNVDAQLLQSRSQPATAAAATAGTVVSASPNPSQLAKQVKQDYLWAYFSTHEEVSLLLDERDLLDFPEDSLVVCPQRWKAIRLVGKDIPFDETGIVKIMSSPYDVGVQLLNMSTYATNVSLVAEDEVDLAVDRLRQELSGDDTKVYGAFRRLHGGSGSGGSSSSGSRGHAVNGSVYAPATVPSMPVSSRPGAHKDTTSPRNALSGGGPTATFSSSMTGKPSRAPSGLLGHELFARP